jgi:hypothetical protein
LFALKVNRAAQPRRPFPKIFVEHGCTMAEYIKYCQQYGATADLENQKQFYQHHQSMKPDFVQQPGSNVNPIRIVVPDTEEPVATTIQRMRTINAISPTKEEFEARESSLLRHQIEFSRQLQQQQNITQQTPAEQINGKYANRPKRHAMMKAQSNIKAPTILGMSVKASRAPSITSLFTDDNKENERINNFLNQDTMQMNDQNMDSNSPDKDASILPNRNEDTFEHPEVIPARKLFK